MNYFLNCILWLALSTSWAAMVQGQHGFCFKNYYNSFGTLRNRRAIKTSAWPFSPQNHNYKLHRRQADMVILSTKSQAQGSMPSSMMPDANQMIILDTDSLSPDYVFSEENLEPSTVVSGQLTEIEAQNDEEYTVSQMFSSIDETFVLGDLEGATMTLAGLGSIDVYIKSGAEPRLGVHAKVVNTNSGSVLDENFTDKTGHVVFSVPADVYNVEVTIPIGEMVDEGPNDGVFQNVLVEQSNTTNLEISFLPPDQTVNIILTIMDETGEPVPEGTEFEVINLSGSVDQTVETMSDDGKILVSAVAGTYTVQPYQEDYVLMTQNSTLIIFNQVTEDIEVGGEEEAMIIVVPTSKVGSISGTVYYDSNGNGVAESGEGIAEVEVKLRSNDDAAAGQKAKTNTTGSYEFPQLAPGNYTVTVGTVLGYKIPSTMVRTMAISLPEKSIKTFDFRIPQRANITGVVYEDTNFNHVPDESEGRKEYNVQLIDSQGEAVVATTTRLDGSYDLVDVISEQKYTIKVADKSGNSKTASVEVPQEGVYTVLVEINPCCSSPFQSFENKSWKEFDVYDVSERKVAPKGKTLRKI